MPVARSAGGFRLYDDGALLRIQWIDRLQDIGFSLSEIRDFLNTLREHQSGPAAMGHLKEFYEQRLSTTREALARLQKLETDLTSSIDYLSDCRGCDPETPRSACDDCKSSFHVQREVPAMVMAVQSM
jgi:DNA-binding transcriptional MerR regulator